MGEWKDIAGYVGCFPKLVSRPPTDRAVYTPTVAFRDVTGVWRVFMSEGGMSPLPYEPTHYMDLPLPPTQSGQE